MENKIVQKLYVTALVAGVLFRLAVVIDNVFKLIRAKQRARMREEE